jgi:hypothetical protein
MRVCGTKPFHKLRAVYTNSGEEDTKASKKMDSFVLQYL